MPELFHGFLAIGTLGSDPSITDPPTPTLSVSVENITEKETEITDNELKLINEELEKVLGAETTEDGGNAASGRNSHVSAERSSHGSTIALSGTPIEGSDGTGSGTITCPLQGLVIWICNRIVRNNYYGKEGAQDLTWGTISEGQNLRGKFWRQS